MNGSPLLWAAVASFIHTNQSPASPAKERNVDLQNNAQPNPEGLDPLAEQRKQDQAEAAALQSWLVANARHLRPVAHVGLMAWALAALRHQQNLSIELTGNQDTGLCIPQTENVRKLTEDAGAMRVRIANLESALAGLLAHFHDDHRTPAVDIARTLVRPAQQAEPGDYDYRTDLGAYFNLSYAPWLTLPRVLMEAMPKAWQEAMATLLHQYDDAYPNQPDLGTTVRVTDGGKIVPTPEWLLNYRHPDRDMITALRAPAGWVVCSPEWINAGGKCAEAPRWFNGPIGQHFHPPVETQGCGSCVSCSNACQADASQVEVQS